MEPIPGAGVTSGAEDSDTPKDGWDRSALYFRLPKGKKAIADSAYEGIPEKVTVKRNGQEKEVTEFIDRAQNARNPIMLAWIRTLFSGTDSVMKLAFKTSWIYTTCV